jgi:hypothetical protein
MERIAAEPVASFAVGKAGKVGGYLRDGVRACRRVALFMI